MFSWFLNPWMLLGGLAIASPILIHLLNKRRFKIVEWAAMDFLFQADKKNRRRVELENFILLLLRCLAMLLLAFMLARPFLPSSLTQIARQAKKFERIFLIDDSLSQRVLNNQLPALDTIKTSMVELLTQLAATDDSENWLTVILTSRPEQPLLANEPLTSNTLATVIQTLTSIETTDTVADYSVALTELNRYVSGQRENVGRVVYFFSDMRERDWLNADADEDSAPNGKLNEIAKTVLSCFLIDVGSPDDENLAVVEIRPDALLLNDKPIRFAVTVANFGQQTAENVRLLFQVDQSQPRFESLPAIAPGQTQQATFLHLFPADSAANIGPVDDEPEPLSPRFHRIRAEVDRQSLGAVGLTQDQLQEDSSALFSAKVSPGISVLLVDGDPSSISERSETHYLRSLQVPGTGLKMQTVSVSEFETIPLSQFQVIFLCNVDEASRDRIENLSEWVRQGRGLVIMPGNRVRAAAFNSAFYQAGAGLSPVSLTQVSGSATMDQWVNFDLAPQVHPALKVIVDSDVASLFNVDIFSWWSMEFDEAQLGKSIAVPLRLTNDTNSPAMVERTWGAGKVVVFAVPSDGDWSMWPSSPTYAPVIIDLIDYLVGDANSSSNLKIGNPILLPVDLAVHQSRVGLRNPKDERIEAVARPYRTDKTPTVDSNQEAESENTPPSSNTVDGKPAIAIDNDLEKKSDSNSAVAPAEEASSDTAHAVRFDNVWLRGFYQAELKQHAGEVEQVLFAANYDPRESRLTRLSSTVLEGSFFNEKVQRVSPSQLTSQTVAAGNSEIWPLMLMVLFCVLVAEQSLAWWWGRKR
jgi:hypothetical protein